MWFAGGGRYGEEFKLIIEACRFAKCLLAPSFVTRLWTRFSFRRLDDDPVPRPSSSNTRNLSTSTSTSALVLTSDQPQHTSGQRGDLRPPRPQQRAAQLSQRLARPYQYTAFFLIPNLARVGGLIHLDTGAGVSIISIAMVLRLGLVPCVAAGACLLTPFYSEASEKKHISAHSYVDVEWHFEGGSRTYKTRFVVMDMPRYDFLLGSRDILENQILVQGADVPVHHGIARLSGG
ncbi:hypothetical protein FE257_007911 [Aspergillus nanangensis]|uniref:Uncharacterized protein n=1 Tax=Aspergillus nanangensis TaxID=2582783 RepID=A0AAD4CYZ7_ASPNN|nr:hypothetical protein FE257_007911 [Aspergillus nanangensis]